MKIKTLEETLQNKNDEIEALNKKEFKLLSKKKQKIELLQQRVLTLITNISLWNDLEPGLESVPDSVMQAAEEEFELLLGISQRLRSQLLEAENSRVELNLRHISNPKRKLAIQEKTTSLKARLQDHHEDFASIRKELGVEWLDFTVLGNMIKDFKKDAKPRIAFLKETLE